MMLHRLPGRSVLAVIAVVLATSVPTVVVAQTSVLTGRVTGAGGALPIPDARVFILGTNLAGVTNTEVARAASRTWRGRSM